MKTRRGNKVSLRFYAEIFLFLGACFVLMPTGRAQAGIADHLVINEIQIDGYAAAGGTDDDWVEIFNPTANEISLAGWSLQKHSQVATSSFAKIALSGIVPAHGYFLAVKTSATSSLLALADLTSGSLSLSDDNTVYLVNNNINIENKFDVNIVDYVGFGNATIFEGAAAASNPEDGNSIVRVIDGEDTNFNLNDFTEPAMPTPQNNSTVVDDGDDDLSGTVLLTVTPNINPAQNIGSVSAEIAFQVNGDGAALVNYGLDSAYGNVSPETAIIANTEATISLSGLACGTVYHYSIYAKNLTDTENDASADAVFMTLPCGIVIDSLTMTKTGAKANDQFESGWKWEFNITVWNMEEIFLKMKFNAWNGANALNAGGNMQYTIDNSNWTNILSDNAYPDASIDISGVDNDSLSAGRQATIHVRMKVPVGTVAGTYNSDYGILVE